MSLNTTTSDINSIQPDNKQIMILLIHYMKNYD